jgi:hypothetical protein
MVQRKENASFIKKFDHHIKDCNTKTVEEGKEVKENSVLNTKLFIIALLTQHKI